MRRSRKKILLITGACIALLSLLLAIPVFIPLFEYQTDYCFYCGTEKTVAWVFGIQVRHAWDPTGYHDGIKMPEHAHCMIGLCGLRWSLYDAYCWDEFGWTAEGVRSALVNQVNKCPEVRQTIIDEYMALDPQDRQAKNRFIGAIRYSPEQLQAGVEPDVTSGADAELFTAVWLGDTNAAATALDHGADVNVRQNGLIMAGAMIAGTPLHYAVFLGRPEMVIWLLNHKADPSVECGPPTAHRTPLDIAQVFQFQEIVDILSQKNNKKQPNSNGDRSIEMIPP